MTIEAIRPTEFLGMVDPGRGTVDRRIFSEQEIYELELERIFARAWNFMAHESQIPNAGDFFLSYIGEDRVIVVRDKEGGVQVLLNTCRHRGNAVCRAEEGHATSFMCTYHGWTYDLKGALVGVPGFKDYYHEDLKREEWGLITAAQVDSYKGFVFATLDPEAIGLPEYLGEVGRLGLDLLAERGDMAIVPGVQKYTIGCNWKLAVDNIWDMYHAWVSHASSNLANWRPGRDRDMEQVHQVMLGDYGHAIGGSKITDEQREGRDPIPLQNQTWRQRPEAKTALGPVGLDQGGHPNIFPNFWITSNQACLRIPKGPGATEIWWFTIIDKSQAVEGYNKEVQQRIRVFGPAGMLEQEDGENWGQSTVGTRGTVAKKYPLNYSMNLGRGEIIEDELGPPRIEAHVNEHAQLWYYRGWADFMAAESWQDLKANHTQVPSGRV